MGKTKILVKVQPEGKYVVDLEPGACHHRHPPSPRSSLSSPSSPCQSLAGTARSGPCDHLSPWPAVTSCSMRLQSLTLDVQPSGAVASTGHCSHALDSRVQQLLMRSRFVFCGRQWLAVTSTYTHTHTHSRARAHTHTLTHRDRRHQADSDDACCPSQRLVRPAQNSPQQDRPPRVTHDGRKGNEFLHNRFDSHFFIKPCTCSPHFTPLTSISSFTLLNGVLS
jgi:hypothetical protein